MVRLLVVLSFAFIVFSLEASKLSKCSVALNATMTSLYGTAEAHQKKVEETAVWVNERLRMSVSHPVAPEDALLATLRSFRSEYVVKTKDFKNKHPLDDFEWERHLLNLEILQQVFHDQVELIDVDPSSFRVAIKLFPGPLDPLYFENVARQVYENVNLHFEYALEAFLIFKNESNNKKINYGTPVRSVAEELARAYLDVRSRLPLMGAMALQLYRIVNAQDAASVLPLEQITSQQFEHFIQRNSSYRMILHEFLKLRKSMKAFEEEPEIRREINRLQRNAP